MKKFCLAVFSVFFGLILAAQDDEMSSVSTTLVEGYSYNAAADASSFGGEGMFMPAFLSEKVNRDMKKNGRKTKDPLYSTTKKSMKDAVVGLAYNITPSSFRATGTIVSEKGLLLTNYFNISSLIDYVSDEEYNYNNGFWAADYYEEVPVKRLTASFLVRTEDVTSEILNITTEKIEDKIKKKEKEASENGKYVAVINSAYGDAKGEPAEYSKSNVPLNTKNHFTISLNGVKPGDLSNNLNNTYKEITQRLIDADYISWILNAKPVDFAGSYSFLTEDENNGVNKEYPVDVQFANIDMRVEKKMLYEYMLLYKEHFKDNIPEAIKNQLKKHKGSWETYANFIVDNSIFSKPKTWKEFIEKPSSSKLEKDPAYVLYAALESQRKEIYSSWPDPTHDKNLYIQGFMDFYSDTQPEKMLYPDADNSLRVSYGPVNGYVSMDGKKYSPNEPDYTVPQSYLNLLGSKNFGRYADEKGNLITCFITQTDILDQSGGGAVLNGKGELTGITADANWDSCISQYIYKQDTQRTICSDIRYILFLIDKYAGATNIINELDIH